MGPAAKQGWTALDLSWVGLRWLAAVVGRMVERPLRLLG